MPFYYQIDGDTPEGRRTADRLLALRQKFAVDGVPTRTLNDSLLLATWNIREFDSNKGGKRLDESMFYIAEIISHFDLVAIQEVREDLTALKNLRSILGRWWKYVVSDVTEGTQGNRERLAFLYDSRKVRFSGVAGEVVLPSKMPSTQIARSPYLVGFQAGWFKFMLCTVHILYGKSTANNPRRVKEISDLSKFLAKRAKGLSSWSSNIILLGDFNIFNPKDMTMKAITKAGFKVPPELQNVPETNIGKKKRHYDQIAAMVRPNQLVVGGAGVYDYYDVVFTAEDEKTYRTAMGRSYKFNSKDKPRTLRQRTTFYRSNWRTHQMSDHLLMWVELGTDFGQPYLEKKAGIVA